MANVKDKLNISEDRYKEIKQECLKSILQFLKTELADNVLDFEQKESLTVAKQCIESCYDIDENTADTADDLVELFHSLNLPPPAAKSAASEEAAEVHKNMGNDYMRDGDYLSAVESYTNAIKTFGSKATYYCNRAAAYSRLEKHREAIEDCKKALKLDPNYGKAYCRLGIAYTSLSMHKEAADAYRKALQLDPTNTSYETNLKLAEEHLSQTMPNPEMFDFNSFMNNPALINMATQMLSDPSFRNISQQIADQLQQSNPNILENLRATLGGPGGARFPGQPDPGNDGDTNPEKKND